MRYGRCAPCEAQALNGLAGAGLAGGFGAIVMTPVRTRGIGLVDEDGTPIDTSTGNGIARSLASSLGQAAVWTMPAMGMASAMAYGAAVTALAAPKGSKGKSAWTASLLAGGLAGVGAAVAIAGATAASQAAQAADVPTAGAGAAGYAPALLYGVAGLAALGYGGYRSYKTFRR